MFEHIWTLLSALQSRSSDGREALVPLLIHIDGANLSPKAPWILVRRHILLHNVNSR